MFLYKAPDYSNLDSFQNTGDIGLSDVAYAGFRTSLYEDMPASRAMNISKEMDRETQLAFQLAPEIFEQQPAQQDGPHRAMTASPWELYVEPNLDNLRKRFPNEAFRGRDDMDTDIADHAAKLRAKFDKVNSHASEWESFFGTLGGGIAAGFADPLNILTLPVSAGRATGSTFLRSTMNAFGRGAMVGAGFETMAQPFVYDYKKDIDSPYELSDAVMNIAFGGIGEGLLAGLGHAVSRGYNTLRGKYEFTPQQEKILEAISQMEQVRTESDAQTLAELQAQLQIINDIQKDILEGRSPDLTDLDHKLSQTIDANQQAQLRDANTLLESFNREKEGLEAQLNNIDLEAQRKLDSLSQKQTATTEKESSKQSPTSKLEEIYYIQKAEADEGLTLNSKAKDAEKELAALKEEQSEQTKIQNRLEELEDLITDQKKKTALMVTEMEDTTKNMLKITPEDSSHVAKVKGAVGKMINAMGASHLKVKIHEDARSLDFNNWLFSRVPDDADVVDIEPLRLEGQTKEKRKTLRDWARERIAGKTVKTTDGKDVLISMSGIKHTVNNAQDKLLATVPYTEQILERGRFIGSAPDRKFKDRLVHYYAIKGQLNEKTLDIVAVVKEDGKGHLYYDHSIERGSVADNPASSAGTDHAPTPEGDNRNSTVRGEDGQIEAMINPETGELHINASAFGEDGKHLLSVLREEIIGHYGIRQVLGKRFGEVMGDIRRSAYTNPELRKAWIDLSGMDPRSKQVVNPNAPYAGLADHVIADEVISKMAREEIPTSDYTWTRIKSIFVKALRAIGLVDEDISVVEMKALIIKSQKNLYANAGKGKTETSTVISGVKPDTKNVPIDEVNQVLDSEAKTVLEGGDDGLEIFDSNGNRVSYKRSLGESERVLAALNEIEGCAL